MYLLLMCSDLHFCCNPSEGPSSFDVLSVVRLQTRELSAVSTISFPSAASAIRIAIHWLSKPKNQGPDLIESSTSRGLVRGNPLNCSSFTTVVSEIH